MAGLLAHGLVALERPSRFPSGVMFANLAAYSCGGSHGFGPDWVVLTVFPFHPLEFIRRGTIEAIWLANRYAPDKMSRRDAQYIPLL